jgi:hypothetical protein
MLPERGGDLLVPASLFNSDARGIFLSLSAIISTLKTRLRGE